MYGTTLMTKAAPPVSEYSHDNLAKISFFFSSSYLVMVGWCEFFIYAISAHFDNCLENYNDVL